jgi:hypothetical protein
MQDSAKCVNRPKEADRNLFSPQSSNPGRLLIGQGSTFSVLLPAAAVLST